MIIAIIVCAIVAILMIAITIIAPGLGIVLIAIKYLEEIGDYITVAYW